MACIGPDGSITQTARNLLLSLSEAKTVEEISRLVDLPFFRIRSSLRELVGAGLVELTNDQYLITPAGKGKL